MNTKLIKPGLFGINHSNRDFTKRESWGKNQFNSSFPASLASYMFSKGIDNVYLTLDITKNVRHERISTAVLYGISPGSDDLYFSFESPYSPFLPFIKGNLPRIDLVTQSKENGQCLKCVEIKLTALPDNSTCELPEDRFGTEIVVRPDTIVYLACSIAALYKKEYNDLRLFFGTSFDDLKNWENAESVLPFIPEMINTIDRILSDNISLQEPLIMQPIWKTDGKSSRLAQNCLDIFVWSNFAFVELFMREFRETRVFNDIGRHVRTIVWLFKMLYDYSQTGQFCHSEIFDKLSFNKRNDKAFAVSGTVTFPFTESKELSKPRITSDEIRNIILGGGQSLLSPERRFDAILANTPELFQ
jgi:hypothetical protein